MSMILTAIVTVLPYLLARRYLATPEDHVRLLRGLTIFGTLYSLPALVEIRLSPQVSRMIYGYLTQPFAISIRDGGFRPVVFLHGGLWLAIFLAMTTIAAFALWKHQGNKGRWQIGAIWLVATLALCHSLGALAIAVALVPIALVVPVRVQVYFATFIAMTIVIYPALRGADVIPVDQIVAIANSISEDRAKSLEFRLKNEDILLAHAQKKPLAGWGGWGRSRVFDEITGQDISVTDGMWIIVIGISGWIGYVATFGLLVAPVIRLAFRRRRQVPVSLATSGLCLVLVANLIDLIPNATLTPVTWLVAGSLAGSHIAQRRTLPSSPPSRQLRALDKRSEGVAIRRPQSPIRRRVPATRR
jgi:hypothetical protein